MKQKKITRKYISDKLKTIGITHGDTIIVHTALSSFGKGCGPDTVIDALLHTIGHQGTLVMPAFGSPDAVFNNKKSDTTLGIVAQTFWKRQDVLRSRHPFASVAAIGPNANMLIEGHENAPTAHGEETPYYRLAQLNGKILLLGVDQDRNTFLHTIEEVTKASYLKTISGKYIDRRGKIKTGDWHYFPGPHRDFIKLEESLRKNGLVREILIGNCRAKLMEASNILNFLLPKLQNDPTLFLSANPNLPDGIRQLSKILRVKIADATFILAADSQFAGGYMEEIIDNMNSTAIDNIVLSTVNDVPWSSLEQDKREWYLAGLKRAGIKVAAIRITNLNNNLGQVLNEINGVKVIVPAVAALEKLKNSIPAKTEVLVENICVTGRDMVSKLNELKRLNAMAAFNPLEFLKIGENPFLNTYTRTSIKSMIGALFVNDGFASGRRSGLEEGLAEIKELISILNCRSFSGLFILQPPNPSLFRSTIHKFFQIYEEVK
ncbi:MAG: AAC(3) family N-acetyltransferase [Phycisphaerales bacterium]